MARGFRASLFLLLALSGYARLDVQTCGTHRDTWKEELHLHRQASSKQRLARTPAAARPDVGHVAILDDSDGVVARRNEFNLDQKTITFLPTAPAAARYRFETTANTYDAGLAPVTGAIDLVDDDTRKAVLPFSFPFFGQSYSEVFVNSDGNLTFATGDSASNERSLGRLIAGPPRIAPLFMDLDPERVRNSVRVLSEPGRFAVSWVEAPEFQAFGIGQRQTFQIRLYPDGRIEFAYSGINTTGAIVGIGPGGLQGSSTVLSFLAGSTQEFSSTVAERFGGAEDIDLATAAQKFYETHEDTYDYLIFYNNLGLPSAPGAVAFEATVRNNRTGYGDPAVEIGREFGSAARLQAVINMGHLAQYPVDTSEFVPARRVQRDTPLTILGHEAGHLFLAFASTRDPVTGARPMLGGQGNAHWAFTFNSEASLLEGNRIRDNGPAVSPRFTTTGAAEGFSPVDQYLMGFRAPDEVPPTFYVANSGIFTRLPQVGVDFSGERRDIRIEDVIAAEGRRTPDHSVAQRQFRFAFILIVRAGSTIPQADLDQVERYRREFEPFYKKSASDRASADATFRQALRLSVSPAAGVVAGRTASATVSLQKPASAPVAVSLSVRNGLLTVPASVTVAAGASSASFLLAGVRAGVEELTAEATTGNYEVASARVQVQAGADGLDVVLISGGGQKANGTQTLPEAIVVRVQDINRLPYASIPLRVRAVPSGTVDPATATTDADGRASFRWAPGPGATQALAISVDDPKGRTLTVATSDSRAFSNPVNAASFGPEVAPGAIATLFGQNLTSAAPAAASFPWPTALAGVTVSVAGRPAAILFASATQVNFLVPDDVPAGDADVTLVADGVTVARPGALRVRATAPGIFFNPQSGFGAILNAGTAQTTDARAAVRGEFIEIYCTGLGAVRDGQTPALPAVTIGGVVARVTFSGLAPGYLGLYQVNAEVPASTSTGAQVLAIELGGVRSNSVLVGVR